MEIDRRYPIVSIRLELPSELAYLAPALEIIVGISVLLQRDDLGEVAKEQRERPSGPDYADGHIVLVQHKDVTVKPGFELTGNHNSYLPLPMIGNDNTIRIYYYGRPNAAVGIAAS